ncbi:E3 ubiquitin-protein ligase SP1 isoform X2 [Cryptomeria japonica]|uniref:E3 ubiquitin-protein ligase SP1 isoform X2 n=1 Tax=Cryptomeria japonica TaxID=3369 RepID=UPI0025AD457D|nr:E3 ubiquitin-protein ligase SP1 isoform X2 [Cryptomeria japonica]
MDENNFRDADILKSVKRVSQIRDLDPLLSTACKVVPLVVSVAGRVGSETPIVCERSRIRGVILEEMVEQHFLKHNDAGSWIPDCAVMPSKSKEVPWYLEDGTGQVYVVGARGASGLELTVASEVFEESGRSFVRGTLDYLQGLKMLGVKRVERVLPTGATLTVVGEAVKDNKTIRIQRPYKGPFYVSPESIDQLIVNLGKWARWYNFASLGLTIFGVYLITKHAIRHILEKRRRRALQRRVMEAAAQRLEQKKQESDQSQTGSQHDNDVKKDNHMQDMCVICLEQEYNAVFVPCGHMCCCTSCSSHLSSCPLCRRRIQQVVKTYRH